MLFEPVQSFQRERDVSPDLSPLEIRASIGDFLERCGLFLQVCPKHTEFAAECIAESDARGYLIPQNGVFKNFIPAGVAMARNAYAHQPHEVQMFISLYTAFLVYLDDMFENDMDAVRQFNHKFISRKPQKLELLDHFAELLHEMPALFGSVVANIMTTSTLNLVTALSIEHEVGGVILEPSAHRFPTFSRVMSGASETYALFMFPSDEPLRHILQALPDCMTFINNGNDILSFYKEQLSNETVNRVYLTAQCRGISQAVVLQELTDEAVASHQRVIDIFRPHKRTLGAYLAFSQGYIGFHSALERYRLHELKLEYGITSHGEGMTPRKR